MVVVEHDPEIIRAADHLIDLGPRAGVNGGEVVFEGTLAKEIPGQARDEEGAQTPAYSSQ